MGTQELHLGVLIPGEGPLWMPARGAGGSTTSSGPAQSGGRAQFPPPLPEGTPQVCENPPSCWSNSPFPESSLWTKQDRLVRLYQLLTAQMQCACRGLHLALCPMGGLVLLQEEAQKAPRGRQGR